MPRVIFSVCSGVDIWFVDVDDVSFCIGVKMIFLKNVDGERVEVGTSKLVTLFLTADDVFFDGSYVLDKIFDQLRSERYRPESSFKNGLTCWYGGGDGGLDADVRAA